MKNSSLAFLLAALLAFPAFARMDAYGPRREAAVGRGRHDERGGHDRDHFVIDRRGGPGWGGVAAAGILGAIAGAALGGAVAPAPVVVGPPPPGTVVAALPFACPAVPTYNGAVMYNCNGIYYQPIYEGAALMYQIVPGP